MILPSFRASTKERVKNSLRKLYSSSANERPSAQKSGYLRRQPSHRSSSSRKWEFTSWIANAPEQ
jgi:hypothetical protein